MVISSNIQQPGKWSLLFYEYSNIPCVKISCVHAVIRSAFRQMLQCLVRDVAIITRNSLPNKTIVYLSIPQSLVVNCFAFVGSFCTTVEVLLSFSLFIMLGDTQATSFQMFFSHMKAHFSGANPLLVHFQLSNLIVETWSVIVKTWSVIVETQSVFPSDSVAQLVKLSGCPLCAQVAPLLIPSH